MKKPKDKECACCGQEIIYNNRSEDTVYPKADLAVNLSRGFRLLWICRICGYAWVHKDDCVK